MAPNSDLHFVVRPLPVAGLEGAFRVHIAPEALDQIGLRVGDVCQISGEDGEVTGYGIAWRAADKMGSQPKTKPVKMTEAMRNAFAIKEGSHITLTKSDSKIVHAQKVVLSDVTPSNYVEVESEVEDERWVFRTGYLLCNCEALTSGMTFDVTAKKGLRKRFYIEYMESSVSDGDSYLYYINDKTQISFADPLNQHGVSPNGSRHGEVRDVLSTKHIGGLVEQIESLNDSMKSMLAQMSMQSSLGEGEVYDKVNPAILIHGYEGTGKSLILQQIEEYAPVNGFHRVIRIQKSKLAAGSVAKNQALIQSILNQARSSQPSIVLIDGLEKLAPSGEDLYADCLADEIDKLAGLDVLVVATCRSPNDVNNILTKSDRFLELIELPIPDLKARRSILGIMLRQPELPLVEQVALRTHGFTGEDLASLVKLGRSFAQKRWMHSTTLTPVGPEKTDKLSNGTSNGHNAAHVEHSSEEESPLKESRDGPKLDIEDFDRAFKKVRPTALKEIFFETPKIKWSDIGGSEAVKSRFDKIIGWPLHRAENLQKLRKRPKKGVLFYGPPGCSKTLTAQAVASTYDLNFIAVKGAELISMYVGESERAVREVFRKARAAAPCVIFFDEIDSIASERESGGTKGLNVLTTLLNEMDGFDSLKGVLVLAATNKPEVIDSAIMRPGRFDSHLYLGPPNASARKEILHINLDGLSGTQDLDFDALVASTEGYSGAEMVHIHELATDETLARDIAGGDPSVTMDDFDKALAQMKRGITEEMLEKYRAFETRGMAS